MRSFWSQIPMMRFALAVITGIGLEIFVDSVFHFSEQLLPVVAVLLLLSAALALSVDRIRKLRWMYRLRHAEGVLVLLATVSFGYLYTWLYAEENFSNHFQKYLNNQSIIVAQIIKPPLEKAKVINVVAQVQELKNTKGLHKATGNILVNFLRDSTSANLQYGDVILFQAPIEEFAEPQNPEEFSFKLYQSFHNIYHRTFLKPDDWSLINTHQGWWPMEQVYRIREYFLSLIVKYVTDKNDFAVASAIMLGYNDYMNGDVVRAYASSGALHVLSVSGLHVGIMFLMLNYMLTWADKLGRRAQITKAIFIIAFIWFYACLTGLSPSVLRSAMMFSMIQCGNVWFRNVNTYNIIFGSALLLLFFNPFIVTEVGFRLSYLAVLGIIYLHPKIYLWLVIGTSSPPKYKQQKNYLLKSVAFFRSDLKWFGLKILDWFWAIVAVSLAAQIATCPLSVFYFHQFPNLFLISNLVVIPASNLILFSGTTLFAAFNVPYAGDAVGWCFSNLLHLLNQFVFYINSLPYALIQGLSITMIEMIGWYLFIIFFCMFLYETKRAWPLIVALVILIGLGSFNSSEQFQKKEQRKIVIYSVPGQSAVAFVKQRKVERSFDSELLNNESSMLFHVKHHWWSCGVEQDAPVAYRCLAVGKAIEFEGKKILLLDSALEKADFVLQHKLHFDLVVLSHNAKVYLQNLQKFIEFDEVVFDSSNKPWRVKYWKQDCAKLKIKYWDVNEQGAYISDLPLFNSSALTAAR